MPFAKVVAAALEVKERLDRLKLASFCRTTGGKGLHVVVPLRPAAGWDVVKPFCRAFAETMAQDAPDRFLAHLKIADRSGRILVDWFRNGLGATAVASYCPRARPGAGVATRLTWSEVKQGLDPTAFTILTVPDRVKRQKRNPWPNLEEIDQVLPNLQARKAIPKPVLIVQRHTDGVRPFAGRSRIVVAQKPKPLRRNS